MKKNMTFPNTCDTKTGQRGSPVGTPGTAAQRPKASAIHFSQGARRSSGERAGNSAKKM